MGYFILSVADFEPGRPRAPRSPTVSATYFEWAFTNKRPDLADGRLRFPYEEDGLHRFESPRTSPACKAATLGDAADECLSDTKKIPMKLHVNWGRASARQSKLALVVG